jgi:hypothetical protein
LEFKIPAKKAIAIYCGNGRPWESTTKLSEVIIAAGKYEL